MTNVNWFGRSVVCAVVLLLAFGLEAVGEPTTRLQTRTIAKQPNLKTGSLQVRVNTQTGSYSYPTRVTIEGPPQRMIRRVTPRWRLGVGIDNAPKGLRVNEVSRYSPAGRFGIEVGDYLLDVMGYPVGLYEGAYYPLADTLNQVTPSDGWVNILIWNRRTGAEEAIWIQAEPRSSFGVYGGGGSSE
jgi:hypothetical protein